MAYSNDNLEDRTKLAAQDQGARETGQVSMDDLEERRKLLQRISHLQEETGQELLEDLQERFKTLQSIRALLDAIDEAELSKAS